ncbi:hypothetical protein ACU686_00830 [Yinghuangia aomiensis]
MVSLVMCLLAARRYVTKEELRTSIESYRLCTSDEAFDRMFERDKDDVRELGFTIETGANDPLVESADGYRIRAEHNDAAAGRPRPRGSRRAGAGRGRVAAVVALPAPRPVRCTSSRPPAWRSTPRR